MYQFDGALRMYAGSGLRTIEDWNTRGRDIEPGTKPRLDAPHRGAFLPLFTRGQTHPRVRSARIQPVVPPTA